MANSTSSSSASSFVVVFDGFDPSNAETMEFPIDMLFASREHAESALRDLTTSEPCSVVEVDAELAAELRSAWA